MRLFSVTRGVVGEVKCLPPARPKRGSGFVPFVSLAPRRRLPLTTAVLMLPCVTRAQLCVSFSLRLSCVYSVPCSSVSFLCVFFFRFVSSLHSPAGSYAKGLSQALRYVSSIYGHSDAHWKSLLGLCVGMQVLLLPHFASLVFEENA